MSKSPVITMFINLLGEIEIEVDGVKGKSCTALTQPLQQALGVVTNVEYKPEYRESDATINQQLRQRS